ncbi:hypothetical protein AB4367_13440, partial [Vibrio breoganii]
GSIYDGYFWAVVQSADEKKPHHFHDTVSSKFGSPCKTCTGRPTGCDISTVHKVQVKKNRIIKMIRFLMKFGSPCGTGTGRPSGCDISTVHKMQT